MAMQGLLSQHRSVECESGARDIEPCCNSDRNKPYLIKSALGLADDLIAAASQSGSDASEMARTIQRLETGLREILKFTHPCPGENAVVTPVLETIRSMAMRCLDTEAAR